MPSAAHKRMAMNRISKQKNIKSFSGFALIEMMVGLFILGVGLLGMASLQNQAVRMSNTAHLYSQATHLANSVMERMRANGRALTDYALGYSDVKAYSLDCTHSSCSESQMALWDLVAWQADLAALLPQGAGEIVVDGNNIIISVRFDDDMGSQEGEASELIQVQINSRI